MSEFRHRASLVLNIVLATTAVALILHKSELAPAPSQIEVNTQEKPVVVQEPQLPRYAQNASSSDQRRWLIDQLRAMGVPNDTLARIAEESIDKEWNRRSAEALWKTHGDDDTLNALQLEEDMGMDAQMCSALGESGFRQWDQKNVLRRAMITKVELTEAEADAIYDLNKKLQQQKLDLRLATQKGDIDPSDMADAFSKANSELAEQMKTILGDDRYAKSQEVDEAVTTADLRSDLSKASPSDSQFQELLKTQQQLNDQRAALDPSSPDYAAQLKALDDARDQEYQRVLGSDAFDTFQKSQDGGYTKMKKFENIWGLDDNKVDSVYAAMQYYQKSIQDYQAQASALEAQGQGVDWTAVNQNMQQFKQQTQQSIQGYLGQDSFNKLQQNGVFYQFTQNQLPYEGPH